MWLKNCSENQPGKLVKRHLRTIGVAIAGKHSREYGKLFGVLVSHFKSRVHSDEPLRSKWGGYLTDDVTAIKGATTGATGRAS